MRIASESKTIIRLPQALRGPASHKSRKAGHRHRGHLSRPRRSPAILPYSTFLPVRAASRPGPISETSIRRQSAGLAIPVGDTFSEPYSQKLANTQQLRTTSARRQASYDSAPRFSRRVLCCGAWFWLQTFRPTPSDSSVVFIPLLFYLRLEWRQTTSRRTGPGWIQSAAKAGPLSPFAKWHAIQFMHPTVLFTPPGGERPPLACTFISAYSL
jgi:hypothetical protein